MNISTTSHLELREALKPKLSNKGSLSVSMLRRVRECSEPQWALNDFAEEVRKVLCGRGEVVAHYLATNTKVGVGVSSITLVHGYLIELVQLYGPLFSKNPALYVECVLMMIAVLASTIGLGFERHWKKEAAQLRQVFAPLERFPGTENESMSLSHMRGYMVFFMDHYRRLIAPFVVSNSLIHPDGQEIHGMANTMYKRMEQVEGLLEEMKIFYLEETLSFRRYEKKSDLSRRSENIQSYYLGAWKENASFLFKLREEKDRYVANRTLMKVNTDFPQQDVIDVARIVCEYYEGMGTLLELCKERIWN